MERAIFPLKYFYSYQGRYIGSHANFGGQNAIDFSVPGQTEAPVYAPYSCRVIFVGDPYGLNAVGFESLSEVEAPNGQRTKQWMMMLHKNSISNLRSGMEFRQDTQCYATGEYGSPGSDHVHIQCGFGNCPATYDNVGGTPHANMEDCVFVPNNVTMVSNGQPVIRRLMSDGTLEQYNWQRGDPVDQELAAAWVIATGDRTTAEKRLTDAQTALTPARQLMETKLAQYNAKLALLQAAEARVCSLEPLADRLVVKTKAEINKLYNEIDTIFL